jgi:hypothetical protein
MGFVAGKRMQIQRDGKPVEVLPGEPVPEAAKWPNLRLWLEYGWVKQTTDAEPVPVPEIPVEVETESHESEEHPDEPPAGKKKKRRKS